METREGQADNVEVAAFDARDVAAGAALDGVAAGFVVGLAGGEVAGDFFRREHGEMDQRGLHEGEALDVGKAEEGVVKEKPASRRISARRVEAEARMSFMASPGFLGRKNTTEPVR